MDITQSLPYDNTPDAQVQAEAVTQAVAEAVTEVVTPPILSI
jgi:hypothetical protein